MSHLIVWECECPSAANTAVEVVTRTSGTENVDTKLRRSSKTNVVDAAAVSGNGGQAASASKDNIPTKVEQHLKKTKKDDPQKK
jgi:hypothetical protein